MTAHQTWSYVQFMLKIYYCWRTDFTFLNAFICILLNAWVGMENMFFIFISIWKKYFSNLLIGNYCKWYNYLRLIIPTMDKKNYKFRNWGDSITVFWNAIIEDVWKPVNKSCDYGKDLLQRGKRKSQCLRDSYIPFFGGPVCSFNFRKSWMVLWWSSPLLLKDASTRQGAFCRTVSLRDPWLWNFWSVSW